MEVKPCSIHCIDCLDGLSQLADNSIDVIFTSPPYNKAGYEGFIRKRHSSDTWTRRNIEYGEDASNDFMKEDEYEQWQILVLNECHRVLKPDGSLFYNHKIRVAKHKACHPLQWCLKSKLTFRQQIIWDRGSSPTVAPIRFIPSTELLLWFTKTPCQPNFKRKIDAPCKTEVFKIQPSRNDNHPATFPKELVDAVLTNIDNKNGTAIVLDPFMGSGTTAISAMDNGFKYIGFEKEHQYVEMARKRILKHYYDNGRWLENITPSECFLCDELYKKRHMPFNCLEEDVQEHLKQIMESEGG